MSLAAVKNYGTPAVLAMFMATAVTAAVSAALKIKRPRQSIALSHPPWITTCQSIYHTAGGAATSPSSSELKGNRDAA
jgi:hypothetical protein